MSDPLSEVLQDIRLDGVSYGRCELRHPWGLYFPKQHEARFHFVASGSCWFHTAKLGWIELKAGDVLLLPRGDEHIVASEPGCHCKPISEQPVESFGGLVFRLREDGDGEETRLFCGSMSFVAHAVRPLIDQMPEVLRPCDLTIADPTMAGILDAMAREADQARVGGATMLARLADVAATHIIRAWVEDACVDAHGWLQAVRDPQLGRALAAMHRSPGQDWTVEALAELAGLSRSSFADKFRATMGEGPAHYVARWRMQAATEWLRENLSIGEIAERLGYESDASFSRAFKRIMGTAPSRWKAVA